MLCGYGQSRSWAYESLLVGILVAPVLCGHDPTQWFLSDEELTASRGGHVRNGFPAWTANNEVLPMIDGQQYMAAVFSDISRAGAGDFLHFNGWYTQLDEVMMPDLENATASKASTVRNVWKDAVVRGVSPRTLQDRNLGYLSDVTAFSHYMNGLKAGSCVTDARYGIAGSHHQKTIVVKIASDTVAYVGGIDITESRWNTQTHLPGDPRQNLEPTNTDYKAWHDMSVRLRGPAVLDIERNFHQRWNDRSWPQLLDRPPKAYDWLSPPVEETPGTCFVQTLRTYSCSYAHAGFFWQNKAYANFAPSGEMSIKAAYLKAISKAQRYVYIEDQFMTNLDFAEAIQKVLPRIEAVMLVTQGAPNIGGASLGPQDAVFNFALPAYRRFQYLFNQTLCREAAHCHKVHWFNLTQPGKPNGGPDFVYVHAKQMLIDDEYHAIGSANINDRSMSYDSEMHVAIVDAAGKHTAALRRNLWGEHLRLPVDAPELTTASSGVAEFLRQADLGTELVRHHTLQNPGELSLIAAGVWRDVTDPKGDCGAELSMGQSQSTLIV